MDKDLLSQFELYMRTLRYSDHTVRTYIGILKIFFGFHQGKDPAEILFRDLEQFNTEYILKKGYSAAYQNQIINAVKLYYKRTPGRMLFLEELERPKKPKRLPVVLSREEIGLIIKNVKNLKHRAILSIIYACGLRISEAINLEIRDIDSTRMIIHIRGGKGNKDRFVGLSPKILEILREYYRKYRPSEYLFEGQNQPQYSTRSIQKILKRVCGLVGIQKHVTVHTLRHSFATHLVESGIDVTHVQKLLGHSNIKTTLMYLHLAKQFYTNIESPFEGLDLNE